jgi:hypothetical protein
VADQPLLAGLEEKPKTELWRHFKNSFPLRRDCMAGPVYADLKALHICQDSSSNLCLLGRTRTGLGLLQRNRLKQRPGIRRCAFVNKTTAELKLERSYAVLDGRTSTWLLLRLLPCSLGLGNLSFLEVVGNRFVDGLRLGLGTKGESVTRDRCSAVVNPSCMRPSVQRATFGATESRFWYTGET